MNLRPSMCKRFLANHQKQPEQWLFCYLFNSTLTSTQQMALQGFCLPQYAVAWFEPTSVELHQTGTFEGRSTDWATAPQPDQISDLPGRIMQPPGFRWWAASAAEIPELQTDCFHIKSAFLMKSAESAAPPAQPPASRCSTVVEWRLSINAVVSLTPDGSWSFPSTSFTLIVLRSN